MIGQQHDDRSEHTVAAPGVPRTVRNTCWMTTTSAPSVPVTVRTYSPGSNEPRSATAQVMITDGTVSVPTWVVTVEIVQRTVSDPDAVASTVHVGNVVASRYPSSTGQMRPNVGEVWPSKIDQDGDPMQ
jgi:hypothetical protein